MSIRLHVNIDHVATLRNLRDTVYPDVVAAAHLCELAGADGITVHLREDRRHVRDHDVEQLRAHVATLLNLEIAPLEAMIEIALRIRPNQVTFVPERREERTTEGGLDVVAARSALAAACKRLTAAGIKPSMFIAADDAQIDASAEVGAHQVEFHTGDYANAGAERRIEELAQLRKALRRADAAGLEAAAGHGLTRHNVIDIAALPHLVEVNIGHAIVADAVFAGLDRAVRDFRAALERGIRRRSD